MSINISNTYYTEDIVSVISSDLPWEELYNSTILITGATGLIGSFLIDVLMLLNEKKESQIHVLAVGRSKQKASERFGSYFSHPCFSFIEQDINNPFSNDICPDYIIHGASNTHPVAYATDPVGTVTTNINGTINILNIAKQQKTCKVVFLSSVEVYGENRGDVVQFTEDYCGYIDCNTLRACYPEAKRVCESICQSYRTLYNTDVLIARLCRCFGPTMIMSDSKATSQFIKKALSGDKIILKSSGKQLYSFIYVADAVSALLTILLKGRQGDAYNIASINCNSELRKFAQTVADLSKTKIEFDLPDETERKGFSGTMHAVLNNSKLQSLGWIPLFDLETAIEHTLRILNKKD